MDEWTKLKVKPPPLEKEKKKKKMYRASSLAAWMIDSAGTVEKDGVVDYDVSPVGVINGPRPIPIDMHI